MDKKFKSQMSLIKNYKLNAIEEIHYAATVLPRKQRREEYQKYKTI